MSLYHASYGIIIKYFTLRCLLADGTLNNTTCWHRGLVQTVHGADPHPAETLCTSNLRVERERAPGGCRLSRSRQRSSTRLMVPVCLLSSRSMEAGGLLVLVLLFLSLPPRSDAQVLRTEPGRGAGCVWGGDGSKTRVLLTRQVWRERGAPTVWPDEGEKRKVPLSWSGAWTPHVHFTVFL